MGTRIDVCEWGEIERCEALFTQKHADRHTHRHTPTVHREVVFYLQHLRESAVHLTNICVTGYHHHFDTEVQSASKNNSLAQYTDCQMHSGMVHQACQEPQEIF